MKINNIKQQNGFTIVELLIVIVVIGILAAITLVAYNGIQARANTTSAQNDANTVMKKAEAYNALESRYPLAAELTATTAPTEAKVDAAALGTPSGTNGKTTVSYVPCPASATATTITGARIHYWDFTLSTPGLTTPTASGNKSLTVGTC